jgi:hypothetical protein
MAEDQPVPVYVSPDGQTEMPITSPTQRVNLESRGWKPKDASAPLATTSQPAAQTDSAPKAARRRQAADE